MKQVFSVVIVLLYPVVSSLALPMPLPVYAAYGTIYVSSLDGRLYAIH